MTPGATPSHIPPELAYLRETEVCDGIERITYRAGNRQHRHTLLFVHGMWHGAWCWEKWQELFAIWGWDSVSFSLPGHAGSATKRPIRWCTLGYYTDFLVREIQRLDSKPVIVGHSLGTALTQRYLKEKGDLPAAVMLAPWLARSMVSLVGRYFQHDFAGGLASFMRLIATPAIRTPERAANIFLSKNANCSAEELHSKLGPESILLPLQHSPLFWKPRTKTKTPMMWITAGQDKLIPAKKSRESAKEFGADFMMCAGAGHDLMMESDHAVVAAQINDWLVNELSEATATTTVEHQTRTAAAPEGSGAGTRAPMREALSNGLGAADLRHILSRLATPGRPWHMPRVAGADAQ